MLLLTLYGELGWLLGSTDSRIDLLDSVSEYFLPGSDDRVELGGVSWYLYRPRRRKEGRREGDRVERMALGDEEDIPGR